MFGQVSSVKMNDLFFPPSVFVHHQMWTSVRQGSRSAVSLPGVSTQLAAIHASV